MSCFNFQASRTPVPAKRQCGIAIITVMLIIALMMTLIGFMIEKQHLMMRRVENQSAAEQGYQISMGLEALATQVLREDGNRTVDYWGEDWATLGHPPIEDEDRFSLDSEAKQKENRKELKFGIGEVKLEVIDLQSRFNLNNLAIKDLKKQKEQRIILWNILSLIGFEDLSTIDTLHGALIDWIDENDSRSSFGFESGDYQSKKTPYFAADQKLSSMGELKYVEGFTSEIINKISPYVTVLPVTHARFNINTASALVLASLNQTIPVNDIGPVAIYLAPRITNENFSGFSSLGGIANSIINTSLSRGERPVDDMMQTRSEFFQLNSELSLGEHRYCMRSVIYRDDGLQESEETTNIDLSDLVVRVVSREYNTTSCMSFSKSSANHQKR